MQDSIRILIVPALLEHDSLGIDIGRNIRRSLGSLKTNQSPTSPTTNTLETELNTMYTQLVAFDVDQEVIVQIFKQVENFLPILYNTDIDSNGLIFQLYYYICANALNNLLLRKDLSYWAKGMQIRFNLSHLEQWIRDKITYVCTSCNRSEYYQFCFNIFRLNVSINIATRRCKHVTADHTSIPAITSEKNR